MQINNLPKDPAMLLSYVNTELRDNYPDLEDFCLSNNVDINDVVGRLRSIDYVYDERSNLFIQPEIIALSYNFRLYLFTTYFLLHMLF